MFFFPVMSCFVVFCLFCRIKKMLFIYVMSSFLFGGDVQTCCLSFLFWGDVKCDVCYISFFSGAGCQPFQVRAWHDTPSLLKGRSIKRSLGVSSEKGSAAWYLSQLQMNWWLQTETKLTYKSAHFWSVICPWSTYTRRLSGPLYLMIERAKQIQTPRKKAIVWSYQMHLAPWLRAVEGSKAEFRAAQEIRVSLFVRYPSQVGFVKGKLKEKGPKKVRKTTLPPAFSTPVSRLARLAPPQPKNWSRLWRFQPGVSFTESHKSRRL